MNRGGFTFLEAVLAILVISLAAPIGVDLWLTVSRQSALGNAEQEVVFQANRAFRTFFMDMTNADSLQAMNAAYVEVNLDLGQGDGLHRYRYYQNGTQFLRARVDDGFTAGEGDLLGDRLGAGSAAFTYYDQTGAVTATLSLVRVVRLAATFQWDAVPGRDPADFSLTQDVYMKDWSIGPNSVPNTPVITGTSSFRKNTNKNFKVTAVDPNGDQVQYQVFWGDGANTLGSFVASGTQVTFTHQWAVAGAYTITATATDGLGGVSPVGSFAITVTN